MYIDDNMNICYTGIVKKRVQSGHVAGGVKMSPVSKANQKAVAKYVKQNYDRIEVKVPKGRKDAIQAAASAQGESLNGFVTTAIDERIERLEGVQKAQEHACAGTSR